MPIRNGTMCIPWTHCGQWIVQPEHTKIQAVQQTPPPQTKKQVRAFLGLTGYYRRFIPDYASIGQLRIEGKECNDGKWTWRHVRSTSGGCCAPLKYSVQWQWRSFLYFARNYSLPYVQSITLECKNRTPNTCSGKRTKSICWSASENEVFFWTRADNGDEWLVEQQSECSVGDDWIGWKWHSWRGIEHSFRKPYCSRAKMVAFVSEYQTT